MKDLYYRARSGSRKRGAAMVLALALTLCLTMLVVATQLEAITELKVSRTERDFERALQMAEAGVNAYQHRLTFGTAAGQPGAGLLPPLYEFTTTPPTAQQFRAGVLNGTYSIIRYPAGSQQGYFAATVDPPGDTAWIVSYGWSNGVVRRVIAQAETEAAPQDIEDDVWLRPSGAYSFFAVTSMDVQNNMTLSGGLGTNGVITMGNNCTVSNGSIVLCGDAASYSHGNNCVATEADQPSPVEWPTVSEMADRMYPSGGLSWLATHNDNADALINGVAGIPGNCLDFSKAVTVIFPSKVGGSNYYLTTAQFKNNATIRFDNSNGPIRIWIGPEGTDGGWYAKNNSDISATSANPQYAPRIYVATTGGFTGKNNASCNLGIYAYNEAPDGTRYGHLEMKNNLTLHGTFVANTVEVKNNAVAEGPFWQPNGAAYYAFSSWQE